VIALTSVIYAVYLLTAPTKIKFKVSYFSIIATVLSGTYLIFLHPSHMAEACVVGLAYLGYMMAAVVASSRKLAKQQI
jgi:hypothetical protein